MMELTNLDIIEFIKKKNLPEAVTWIVSVNGSKRQSVTSSLIRLKKKFNELLKLRNDEKKCELLQIFKTEKYRAPNNIQTSRISPTKDQYLENGAPKSSYTDCLHGYRHAAHELAIANSKLEQNNYELRSIMRPKVKNLQRTKTYYKSVKSEVQSLTKKNKHLRMVNEKKTAELKRSRLSAAYLCKQNRKLKEVNETLKAKIVNFQVELDINRQVVHDLGVTVGEREVEIETLRELVEEEIQTFNHEKKNYTTEVQECVYSLLQNNVTSSKVSPVIDAVMKLANKKASKLPSRSTINEMNVQRLMLSHRQIEEQFSERKNTCLLSDETSKFGKNFQGFHAADEEGRTWCLGVREMATKGSETVLSTFQEILTDIDEVSKNDTKRSEEILTNITSTMSDRAATQVKFNNLLEDFRSDIVIRNIGDGWQAFSADQKSQLTKLCNFFCSLHVLVHMAESASAALIQYEKSVFDTSPPINDKSFQKPSEPGATRLIRTASKAFAAGGDEKSGAHGSFRTYVSDYLKQHKLRSVPLERFRGNRFNILFSSAASVHFLAEEMKGFLQFSADNRLLQAVKADLNTDEYLAGCKARGLVSELITVPLWAQIERTDITIIDIGSVYREVVDYLEHVNTDDVMAGRALMSFVDEEKVRKSVFMKELLKEHSYDEKVEVVLKIMLPALHGVTKRLFKDHLADQLWHNPEDVIKNKTLATPNHNKFSETIFGVLDRILREKPNISLVAAEAYLLFCHNKTLAWIDTKPREEKEELLASARREVKKMKTKFAERRKCIEEVRKARLAAARQKIESRQIQRLKRKENMTDEILIWGLWQSEQEVDSALVRCKTAKDRSTALSAQLRFRKNVLQQSVESKNIYALSKTVNGKSVKVSVPEMTEHLKTLVRDAFRNERQQLPGDSDPSLIVGRNVRHCLMFNEERQWFHGKVISQVPGYSDWYNLKYTGDPAIYTYKLIDAYKLGQLEIVV